MAKRQSVDELIQKAALAGAQETVRLQRHQRNLNLYRTTERMLRNYKTYQRLVEDIESYGFEPVEKSHSVSVAPPPGSSVMDKVDLYDEYVAARKASWARTKARYDEIDAVVRQFEGEQEFIVIRMYYFNEDAYAYGSRSAERTMEKYATLQKALESYFDARDIQSELRDKLLEIGEAMKRAEKQMELYGEKSLPVRQVIADVKRIVYGKV